MSSVVLSIFDGPTLALLYHSGEVSSLVFSFLLSVFIPLVRDHSCVPLDHLCSPGLGICVIVCVYLACSFGELFE